MSIGAQHKAHPERTALNLKSDTRQTAWRLANPHRYKAHVAVGKALNKGELEKGPCEVCQTTEGRIDAHHDDYSRPLEVRWLCRRHHNLLHSRGDDLFAERRSA